jgi:4-hydroxybenzoate polyprenyltransferase
MCQSMCSETNHAAPNSSPGRSLKTWLTLLRVPNLLTVPGDPLAGAFLAAAASRSALAWTPVFQCLLASLALYSSGLLANDFFDREEDRRDRPTRPIPSGNVRSGSVLFAALLLTMAGITFAAEAGRGPLQVALLLAAAVWAYNLGVKRVPVAGPILMGACRGLSLLLGAAACPAGRVTDAPWLAAGLIAAYIALVTAIARNETRVQRTPLWAIWLSPTLILAGLASLSLLRWENGVPSLIPGPNGFALGLSAMAVVWVGVWNGQLVGQPAPARVQRAVGGLIRGLILIQAALCATTGPLGELGALALLAAFPVAGWLGKWFYGS